jgi:methyl-accepting chemotaxis protein
MRIKTKLGLNIVLVLAAVGSVVLAGVLGMSYIQKNLLYLTRQSTPFQTGTTALQEALQQAHASFVQVSASRSRDDYARSLALAERSLEEVKRRQEELESLTAGGERYTVYQDLAGTARRMFESTAKRLAAEEQAGSARRSIAAGMARTSRELGNLSADMKRFQNDRFATFSLSLEATRETSTDLRDIETLKGALNDLTYTINELQNSQDRKGLLVGKSRYAVALAKVQKCDYLKRSPKVRDQLKKLAERVDQLIAARSAARPGDDGKEKQPATGADLGETSALISVTIDQEVKAARERYGRESERQRASFSGATEANAVLSGNSELVAAGLAVDSLTARLFTAANEQEVAAIQNELAAIFNRAGGQRRSVEAKLASLGAKQELSTERSAMDSLMQAQRIIFAGDGIIAKVRHAQAMRHQAEQTVQALQEIVEREAARGRQNMAQAHGGQEQAIRSITSLIVAAKTGMLLMGFASLAIGILFAISLERSITRPVRELNAMAEALGNGDFTIRLDDAKKNEFGELAANFNQATAKVREMSGHIARVIEYLASHSLQLSGTAEGLSQGARDQSSQTDQSSQAMSEISRSITEVAVNAGAAAETTKEALGTAAAGNSAVASTVDGMLRIAASVRDSTVMIRKLEASSAQIGSIVSVIRDIADQTNLLALNAAIESARAGNSGRGFAVVADQVRHLAAKTAESTRDIELMVRAIQEDTGSSLAAMEQGSLRVEEGVALAEKARHALDEILAVTSRGAETVERIATAAEEQSVTAQQVSANVMRIAEITRRAESETDDITRSSVQLRQLADELAQVAAWFKA